MGCIFAKQAVTGTQSRAGPLAEQVEPVNPFEHRGPTNGSEGRKAHTEPLHIWANDVEYSHEQLPSVQASELDTYISGPSVLGGTKATKRILEGFSHDYKDPSNDLEGCPFVYPSSDNPLIAAAHMAFYRHLPLALHPDTLWVCILKGIAHHVYNYVPTGEGNPVTGKGEKIELSVRDDTLVLGPGGRGKNNWAGAIDNWCSQINSHIGSRLPMVSKAMHLRFSTSTQITATAFNVAFMSAFHKYFEYTLRCVCGIPHVELHGSKEDWEQMIQALDMLDEIAKIDNRDQGKLKGIDLLAWKRQLQGVLAHFVAAYDQDAQADQEFWSRIFKHWSKAGSYGDGERVTGWICKFVPYTKYGAVNGIAEGKLPEHAGENRFAAYRASEFGGMLSEAPFKLKYHGRIIPMVLISGLVGVRQKKETGTVWPEAGWLCAREDQRGKATPNDVREAEEIW